MQKINIRDAYGSRNLPQYARGLVKDYGARKESFFISGEVHYDKDYVYIDECIELEGSIENAIWQLQKYRDMGCKEIRTSHYLNYGDEETAFVVEGVPYARFEEDRSLTDVGAALLKVIDTKKASDQKKKDAEAAKRDDEVTRAAKLLKKHGYKVQK